MEKAEQAFALNTHAFRHIAFPALSLLLWFLESVVGEGVKNDEGIF